VAGTGKDAWVLDWSQQTVLPLDPGVTPLDAKINPAHYRQGKVECIDIIRDRPFCIAAAMKYLWRYEDKGDSEGDLRKAIWYIEEELDRRGFSARPRPDR
jgi:hypothetical protein